MKIIKSIFLSLLIVLLLTGSGSKLLCDCLDTAEGTVNKLLIDLTAKKELVEVDFEEYYIYNTQHNRSYNALNSRQKKLYKKIYAISREMPDGFVQIGESYSNIQRDVAVAYNAFLYDRVEIFWMPYTYIVTSYSENGKQMAAISFNHSKSDRVNYLLTKEKRDEYIEQLSSKVSEIVKEADNLYTEYEKEKFFNDYICKNTAYSIDGELNHTSFGALVNGNAHCEGYSKAFKLLCNEVGIECDLICGTSDGEGHMWNIVNIDGTHNYVDVTWNDRTEHPSYMYFNITTEQLEYDHKISPNHNQISDGEISKGSFNFAVKPATYSGNTYYAKTDSIIDNNYTERLATRITEESEKGNTYAEFLFDSDKLLEEFKRDDAAFFTAIQRELKDIQLKSFTYDRDVLAIIW